MFCRFTQSAGRAGTGGFRCNRSALCPKRRCRMMATDVEGKILCRQNWNLQLMQRPTAMNPQWDMNQVVILHAVCCALPGRAKERRTAAEHRGICLGRHSW